MKEILEETIREIAEEENTLFTFVLPFYGLYWFLKQLLTKQGRREVKDMIDLWKQRRKGVYT